MLEKHIIECHNCGVEFEVRCTSKNWERGKYRKYCCSQCAEDHKEILEENKLSKRDAVKLAKKLKLSCALCGWNELPCEVHHIISQGEGGSDDLDNLIYVCPNCHRILHKDKSKYGLEYLKEHSIIHYKKLNKTGTT